MKLRNGPHGEGGRGDPEMGYPMECPRTGPVMQDSPRNQLEVSESMTFSGVD
jgi:hypothetical protein